MAGFGNPLVLMIAGLFVVSEGLYRTGVAAWIGMKIANAASRSEVRLLLLLMPVVASMGGIAGSQTLTLTIRGLALDQIAKSNVSWLTRKELLVGMLNGVVFSVLLAVIAWLWYDDLRLGMVMAAAILLNLVAGALAGALVPVMLRRMSIDPALAGGVVLTTVTDVIGIVAFVGLATFILLR